MDDTRQTTRLHLRRAWFVFALVLVATWGHDGAFGEPGAEKPAADATVENDAPPGPPEIHVPEGFTVEQVAGPPLVEHPMMAGFDDQGRLYVADAVGVNLNAEELERDLPNRIQRLEDTDGDGRFDRATTFADKMTFPMGALWHDGAVYTASPPYIWRLEDTDDDGVADRREQIVGKFGFIGNAADIHGCFLGPEGRIYWCDGRHGHEFVDAEGNTLSKGLAARIFSCRPDGSDVQVYAGGGMDNPVEVAFTAEGEMLGTMTFYNPDEVRHDALVHYAYGGVYPRNHPCVSEFKRTGDFMPPLSLYDTVAPAGLTRYRGTAFGADYQNNFFSVQFNTHKVIRHILEREGATFRATDEDFLTSPSIDFHPTDVLEDADGSLLVINTGGWFRNGCPTSQIAKPEILGAIYRVRKADAPAVEDPRGRQLDWLLPSIKELVVRLGDKRPAVQDRAVEELAARGPEAVGELAKLLHSKRGASVRQRAIWTLARIDNSDARTAIRAALRDRELPVRLAAARAVSASRDPAARLRLKKLLTDQELAVRREAATALGRIGYGDSVSWILESMPSQIASQIDRRYQLDRHTEHAMIYALIEIGEEAPLVNRLAASYPAHIRRAALLALESIGGEQLTNAHIALLLDGNDAELQRTALEVLRHREGGAASALEIVVRWLADPELADHELSMLRGAISAFADNAEIQQRVAAALLDDASAKSTRLTLLEAISRSELDALPDAWRDALSQCFHSEDDDVVAETVMTARAVASESLQDELTALVADDARPLEMRRSAACAVARPGEPLSTALFDVLLGALSPQSPPLDRIAAARALGEAKLDHKQWMRVCETIPQISALEIPVLVRSYREQDEPTRNLIAQTIKQSKQWDAIDPTIAAEMHRDLNPQEADDPQRSSSARQLARVYSRWPPGQIAKLVEELDEGVPLRGRNIFFDNKSACSACHRIEGKGGQIGPDLSHIGAIRTPLDLVESIVAPSSSFARGYETYIVTTTRGGSHFGVITGETASSIYLTSADRAETRIARKDIDEMQPSTQSIMPDRLDQLLSKDNLRDLVAFLSSLK